MKHLSGGRLAHAELFRLNLSHTGADELEEAISLIRSHSPTPICLDTEGPQVRCGPMADETMSWLNRVALGLPTPAATIDEAHKNLMLTKALDLSAKTKQPVKLPLEI